MKQIKVMAEHEYQVVFGDVNVKALESFVDGATRIALIVPRELRHLALQLKSELEAEDTIDRIDRIETIDKVIVIDLPEGEQQKTIETVSACWKILGDENFRRDDVVIGIGGGATTDVAGFIASTWLRGIRWAAIPTSLAGMVDAAIGGKTGINTEAGKNLVGAFYSPQVVLIDFHYLTTLPEGEYRAGLAEIIKCGFIGDQKILELFESRDDFFDPSSSTTHELIERAVNVKAEIVSKDLRESYLRESLNYGHTLAHAIERVENYSWRHGDAVAVGLAYIANLAELSGVASEALRDRHLKILNRVGLPTSFKPTAWPELLNVMQSDKKARSSGLRFVAVNDKYEVIRLEGLDTKLLQAAYERISS